MLLFKSIAIFLFALLYCASCEKSYENYKLVCVRVSKEEDLAKLRRDFEGNEEVNYILEPTLGRSGTILVSPSALKKLLGTGVNVTVLNENFQRTIDEERRQTISVRQVGLSRDVSSYFHTFPRHSEINDFIALLARTNSSLALIETIGRSYENRPMNVIKIGKNHQSRQKPVIWIDAGIHAREWAAPVSAMFIANSLIQEYSSDPSTKTLVDKYDWYILPSANPDGYEYSHTRDRMWRKTRSLNNERCVGVDPNRNWGYEWNPKIGGSSNPCSDIYSGPKPFSEKETQTMRDYILANKDRIRAYFSIHSYSQLWLTPWGYTSKYPNNYPDLKAKADVAVRAIKAKHGKEFTVGSSTNVLYPAAGGSDDWALGVAGIPYAYTLELRPHKYHYAGFVLPVNEIIPTGEETWAGIKAFALSI